MNTIQSWWGNNVFTNTADWNGVPLRSVVEGDHFGCVLYVLTSGPEYAGTDVCAAGRTLGRLAVCCNIRCICCCRSQCFYWVIDAHFGGTLRAACAWTVPLLRILSLGLLSSRRVEEGTRLGRPGSMGACVPVAILSKRREGERKLSLTGNH